MADDVQTILQSALAGNDVAAPAAAPAAPAAPAKVGLPSWAYHDQPQQLPPSADPAAVMSTALQGSDVAPKQQAPASGIRSGLAANYGAGFNESAAGLFGLPADLTTAALNALRGLGSIQPEIKNPVGGSDWFKSVMGLIPFGGGADPRKIVATNEGERIARGAGQGTAATVLPFGLAKALPALSGIPGTLQKSFSAGSPVTQGVAGAIGGGTGTLAEDLAPEPYKPYAGMLGNLLGGGLTLGGIGAGKYLASGGSDLIRNAIQPLTTSGQEQLAGQRIAKAASNLDDLKHALDTYTSARPDDLVPGSFPTSYQLTGDQGIGNLERWAAKNDPDAFLARDAQQNKARTDFIDNLTPNASPDAVGRAFTQQLQALDASNNATIDAARTHAQQAVTDLGGVPPGTPDQQVSALQNYGQRWRAGLAANNNQTRADVSTLYRAVDPDGTITVHMSPIRDGAEQIISSQPQNAKPLTGEIGDIFDTARNLPDVQPFGEATALRSRITDEMRTERMNNGQSNNYRLLTQLLGHVDGTLSEGVQARAAQEAAAVRTGQMSPDDAILSRVQGWADDWRARQATAGPTSSGGGTGPNPPGGVGGFSGMAGAEGARQGGPGNPPGDSTLASEAAAPVTTPFDAAAEARYRAANAAHAERVATFETAPGVGQVLAPGARSGEWKLGDSQVPAQIFKAGAGAAERVQAFLRAGGDNQALASDLRDHAAFELRRSAENPDGTLDPARTARWVNQHSEALNSMPGLRAQFENAAQAQATVDQAIASHATARRAFETSAAAKFIGTDDPATTVGRILNSDTSVAQMQDLAARTAGDPAARAGLRRAVTDYMTTALRSTSERGGELPYLPDKTQKFIRQAAPALRTIFSPEEVQGIQNMAADVRRSGRSVTGTKLPGGSNTPQDLAAEARHGAGNPSTLNALIAAEAGGEMLQKVGGFPGKILGMIGVPIYSGMRAAGLENVNNLVSEAMRDPGLMKSLLAKVPTSTSGQRAWGSILKGQLRALAVRSLSGGGFGQPGSAL